MICGSNEKQFQAILESKSITGTERIGKDKLMLDFTYENMWELAYMDIIDIDDKASVSDEIRDEMEYVDVPKGIIYIGSFEEQSDK